MSSRRLRFHFTLRDARQRVLDTSRGGEPLACTEGEGEIIDGLERVLRGMQPGERRQVVVPPEQGYGLRDDSLVQKVPAAALPVDGIQAGDRFRTGPDPADPVVTVVRIEGDGVVLDANHPLAGQTLHFDVELVSALPSAGR